MSVRGACSACHSNGCVTQGPALRCWQYLLVTIGKCMDRRTASFPFSLHLAKADSLSIPACCKACIASTETARIWVAIAGSSQGSQIWIWHLRVACGVHVGTPDDCCYYMTEPGQLSLQQRNACAVGGPLCPSLRTKYRACASAPGTSVSCMHCCMRSPCTKPACLAHIRPTQLLRRVRACKTQSCVPAELQQQSGDLISQIW